MSNTLAQVRNATMRARTEYGVGNQLAEKGLAMYHKILLDVRASNAATPSQRLGMEISALERIVKAMEDFAAFMAKHMEEFGVASTAQPNTVALLAFLEEDYAKFVRAHERMWEERRMVESLGFLRPEWVMAEVGLAPSTLAVAGPVVEEEEKAVEPPKNRAGKRRLEREAKKAANKKK